MKKENQYHIFKNTKTMKSIVSWLIAVIAVGITLMGAFAVPNTFDYQGVLRNATTGQGLTGIYTFNFTLYNSSNNVLLYSEQSNLSVKNGIWDYTVGTVTAISPSYFSANTYIITSINGQNLTRINLTSVPYAFYSLKTNNSDYLGGIIASSYLTNIDNVNMNNHSIFNVSNISINGISWFDGNLMPTTTLVHDIGSGTNRWNVLYVANVSTDYLDATRGITTLENVTASYFHGSGLYLTGINITGGNWTGEGNINILGYMLTTSYISGVVGSIDMRGNPWYLSGTSLQVAGDITANNFYGNINASQINNSYWLTSESDPVFVANRTSIWDAINSKFDKTGGTITGNLLLNGNLTVIGQIVNLTVTDIYANGSYIPDFDNLFDIGSSTNRYANGYFVTLYGNVNASQILNSYWLTSESDPVFVANRTSIWDAINSKYSSSNPSGYINSTYGNATYYLASNPNNYIDTAGETDPQVGTLTSAKWCWVNIGDNKITCDQEIPATVASVTDVNNTVATKLTATATTCSIGNYSRFNGTGFQCFDDVSGSGADGNNYSTSVEITGTATKTIIINRTGMSNINASWTDLDTGSVDTVWNITGSSYLYNNSGVLSINETALNATGDLRYVNVAGDTMTGDLIVNTKVQVGGGTYLGTSIIEARGTRDVSPGSTANGLTVVPTNTATGGSVLNGILVTPTTTKSLSGLNGVSSTLTSSGSSATSIDNAYGFKSQGSLISNVTNLYLFYGADATFTRATNYYGLYLESLSGATNTYAIYTGTGKIRFGDNVNITGNLTFGPNSGVNASFVQNPPWLTSVPYQSSAAGWTNTSSNTSTGIDLILTSNNSIYSDKYLKFIGTATNVEWNFTSPLGSSTATLNVKSADGGLMQIQSGVSGETKLTFGANRIQPAGSYWGFYDGSTYGFLVQSTGSVKRFLVNSTTTIVYGNLSARDNAVFDKDLSTVDLNVSGISTFTNITFNQNNSVKIYVNASNCYIVEVGDTTDATCP